jgi:REP element-mobilizing transposase RayT
MRRKTPINDVGYYHVGARGTYGRPLFRDEGEHELFLDLYAMTASKYGWKTLAWALMWNHHHFLIRLVDGGLSAGMRSLHSNFSRRMNTKDGLTNQGHLVRHCFFASECLSLESIKRRARYIDLNPVTAGLCAEPGDWPWSSYAATMDRRNVRPFHQPEELLSLLEDDPRDARGIYETFVREGPDPEEQDPWTEQGLEPVRKVAVIESLT